MVTADDLNSELHRLGIHFLVGDSQPELFEPLSPSELLAGLAAQSDARLRSALIVLLLQLPDLAAHAPDALESLEGSHRRTFQLYFTAAHYLQLAYFEELSQVLGTTFSALPDLYSAELHLGHEGGSPADLLVQLAIRHREISGLPINWSGTYHHAAQRVIARLKKEQEWARV